MDDIFFIAGINVFLLALLFFLQPMLRDAVHGIVYAASSLDDRHPPSMLERRLGMVASNQMETTVMTGMLGFLALATLAGGSESLALSVGGWGLLHVAMRLVYIASSLAGLAWVRPMSWAVGFLALLAIAFDIAAGILGLRLVSAVFGAWATIFVVARLAYAAHVIRARKRS